MAKSKTKTDLTPERFLITVAYDGTDYMGWQIQNDVRTVQGEIQARISRIFKNKIVVQSSGRTDAGVHSVGQCFHFDAFWPHSTSKLQDALNTGEQAGLLITQIRRVHPKFHARYSAIGKRYRYEIHVGFAPPWKARYCLGRDWESLDVKEMRRAAKMLVGKHDFRAFGATHGQGMENEHPVKDLRRLDLKVKGRHITVTTEANGYLIRWCVDSWAASSESVKEKSHPNASSLTAKKKLSPPKSPPPPHAACSWKKFSTVLPNSAPASLQHPRP